MESQDDYFVGLANNAVDAAGQVTCPSSHCSSSPVPRAASRPLIMSDEAETPKPFYEVLTADEVYWRDKYQWLLDSGYKLRPLYHPEWVPSWKKDTRLDPMLCEDVLVNNVCSIFLAPISRFADSTSELHHLRCFRTRS